MTILIYELFPHCNLNCNFCFQRSSVKKDEYNNNYAYSKIDYIQKAKQSFIDNFNKTNNKTIIDTLCLWGGELFYDNGEEYYRTFWDFINTIKPKHIFYYTNLMKINKILNELLFDDKLSSISQEQISYDPIGRFNNKDLERIFFNNLLTVKTAPKFQNNKINISVILQPEVITKQCDLTALKQLMSDPQINIIFKEYELPYPEDIKNNYNNIILEFYREFYNCDNINQLKHKDILRNDSINIQHYCPCFSHDTYFFTYANEFTFNPKATCDTYLNGKDQLKDFLDNYDCDNCPYKERCVDVCPSRMINSGLKECYKKFLFQHLEEIPDENDTI